MEMVERILLLQLESEMCRTVARGLRAFAFSDIQISPARDNKNNIYFI